MSTIRRCCSRIAAVVVLAATPFCFAQPAATLSTSSILLQESLSTPINVPNFKAITATQCDQNQSIYSLVKTQGMPHDVVISISRDGRFKNVYTLDSTLDREPGTVAFSVAPDGTVFLLDQLPDKGTYLQRYDKHGKPLTPTRIALPSNRLNVSQLAVNNNGRFFVSGIYGDEEPAPRTSAPFIAIFDSDGQHFREVTEIGRGKLVNDISNSYTEQALTTADDGSFYLQVRNHIFAIDEGGHVLRDLKLDDWPEGASTHLIKISGNKILVAYLTLDAIQTRMLHLHLKLYDLTTGALIATYDPSAVSDILACFDYQKGFTFLKVRQGQLSFVDAALPSR